MSAWETIGEEASIVLVGNFNPKIFHPEWFAGKGIVEEWDYSNEEIIHVPDMAQMELPGERRLTVLLNKFTIRATHSSEHIPLRDIVTNAFSILAETPITQMGMNFTSHIKIADVEKWKLFGDGLAPKNYWLQAAPYIKDLPEKQQDKLGLLDITMNLPRSDAIPGHIRPQIVATSLEKRTLSFSINNHVSIESSEAKEMIAILDDKWEASLEFATTFISTIMESQLGA